MIYYAHPVSMYDSDDEKFIVKILSDLGPVLNPNGEEHQKGYDVEGMAYFIRLLEECSSCVFSTFRDGKIGAGAAKEIKYFLERKLPVFQCNARYDAHTAFLILSLRTNLSEYEVLTVDETRAKLKELGFR